MFGGRRSRSTTRPSYSGPGLPALRRFRMWTTDLLRCAASTGNWTPRRGRVCCRCAKRMWRTWRWEASTCAHVASLAHGLDQLRIEADCEFAQPPQRLYYKRRRTLAEEHHWRAHRYKWPGRKVPSDEKVDATTSRGERDWYPPNASRRSGSSRSRRSSTRLESRPCTAPSARGWRIATTGRARPTSTTARWRCAAGCGGTSRSTLLVRIRIRPQSHPGRNVARNYPVGRRGPHGLPLAEARHAHELLESAASKGKLVLVP